MSHRCTRRCVTVTVTVAGTADATAWGWVAGTGAGRGRASDGDRVDASTAAVASVLATVDGDELLIHLDDPALFTVPVDHGPREAALLAELRRRRIRFTLDGTSTRLHRQARRLAQIAAATGAGHRHTGPLLTGTVTVACDGAYDHRTGIGGWAWWADGAAYASDAVVDAGSSTRMEIEAILAALDACDPDASVTILSDCLSVVETVTGRADGRPVRPRSNPELVDRLRSECARRDVTVVWVPGHAGVDGNVQADRAARGAVRATCT